jgi:uncharacterized protein YjbI with pentapeptide repeats
MATAVPVTEWTRAALQRVLKRLRADGSIDASDVRITGEQLRLILAAAPADPEHDGRPTFRDACFRGAVFAGDVDFRGTTFAGDADFALATFVENASFLGTQFLAEASFVKATFERNAYFYDTRFDGEVSFSGTTFTYAAHFVIEDGPSTTFDGKADFWAATFLDQARFYAVTFAEEADFHGAVFTGGASFGEATFAHKADFGAATFAGGAWFFDASFGDDVDFARATFAGEASFAKARFHGDVALDGVVFTTADLDGCVFERARVLGPLFATESLALNQAVFSEQVTLQASTRQAALVGATFRGGADLLLRWAQVRLDEADFEGPSLVTSLGPAFEYGRRALLGWEEPTADGGWHETLADSPPSDFRPRVISVRGAKVADLVLSAVDLRACRFAGAHALDRMRLELARVSDAPPGWQWRALPWRWTRRQTLAEEHQWRHGQRRPQGWYEAGVRVEGDTVEPLAPEQIATIYRALRKGREDIKDEPGAADFYYGEMEMRRQRPETGAATAAGVREAGRAERFVLLLYWLVSGYGLRASRALAALALTIVVFAVCLYLWGFDDQPLWRALLFSAESTASLFRVPDKPSLTPVGEALQLALRLLGPLFFGLALLSLRGRVKR